MNNNVESPLKNIINIYIGLVASICTLLDYSYGVISSINLPEIILIPIILIIFSIITGFFIWPSEKIAKILSDKFKGFNYEIGRKFTALLLGSLVILISLSRLPIFLAERVFEHTELCNLNEACIGWVHYATFQKHEDYQGIGQPFFSDFSFEHNPQTLEAACPAKIEPMKSITVSEDLTAFYWAPTDKPQEIEDVLQTPLGNNNSTQNICPDRQNGSCARVAHLAEDDRVRILDCVRIGLINSEYELWVKVRDQNFNKWRHQNDR